jgi:hypothetical protein
MIYRGIIKTIISLLLDEEHFDFAISQRGIAFSRLSNCGFANREQL